MKIIKFGGTSVGTVDRIGSVVDLIVAHQEKEQIRGVVFSAFGGVTDQLIELSQKAALRDTCYEDLLKKFEEKHLEAVDALVSQNKTVVQTWVEATLTELRDTVHGVCLVKELTPKTQDFIMSFGERLSAYIICAALGSKGVNADYLDARSVIKTNETFGFARVNKEVSYQKIKAHFDQHQALQVITGFIGSTEKDETSTLGRGGSDYTLALVGAALHADEVTIWTDVDGVMTADPNKVPKAFPIDSMTYEEAFEMSHFGARVIYPPTIQPLSQQDIPIRIKNTFNPDAPGTVIGRTSDSGLAVKGISSIDRIALLRLQGSGLIGVAGISHRLFGALAKGKINVILISQASSEHSICFAVAPDSAALAKQVIDEEFSLEVIAKQIDPVIIESNMSILAIVGENMRRSPGISGRLFDALGKNGVNVAAISQGSSELNISVVINKADEKKSLNALHEAFFLSDTKTLHVFLLGTGLIGSTFLKQLNKQRAFLKSEHALDIKPVALGNIAKMVFDADGIDLNRWQSILEENGSPIDVFRFVETMKKMNLPNSVFVECTGDKQIVDSYESILASAISIVTPNKIANSGPFSRYKKLKETAYKHGVKFLYETNVGAGLPVISTLSDLMSSGDRILKIEAVLSGTISYIFNSFTEGRKFSQIVREAREKGLSEPDPRDDLNGVDVARKLLILARDTGLALEPEDIALENLVPEFCRTAPTVDAFLDELPKADDSFETIRKQAAKKFCKLCYIATLENDKARIALEQVDGDHPFYSLSGSDNMIVFTTERYKERPLVVKGPGAGAEVTAAGVFADVIRIAHYLT